MSCTTCGKPSTVHITAIVGEAKGEEHLCEECALRTFAGTPFAERMLAERKVRTAFDQWWPTLDWARDGVCMSPSLIARLAFKAGAAWERTRGAQ